MQFWLRLEDKSLQTLDPVLSLGGSDSSNDYVVLMATGQSAMLQALIVDSIHIASKPNQHDFLNWILVGVQFDFRSAANGLSIQFAVWLSGEDSPLYDKEFNFPTLALGDELVLSLGALPSDPLVST